MDRSHNRYPVDETYDVARTAAAAVEAFLRSRPGTLDVRNVEADPAYRERDIDLLWVRRDREIPVEVKGDRWSGTGNFFLETVSNAGLGTPGCFLYTEAEFVFYLFVGTGDLYVLPMPAARDWFMPRQKEFRERRVETPCSGGTYTTIGRLVPIRRVLAEVPGVRQFSLPVAGSPR